MTLLRCTVVCTYLFLLNSCSQQESITSKNTNRFVNDSIVSGLLLNVGVNGTDTVEAGDWEGYFKFIEQRDDNIIYDATWLFNRILFENCIAETDLSMFDYKDLNIHLIEVKDTIEFEMTEFECVNRLMINTFWSSDTLIYRMETHRDDMINYNSGKWLMSSSQTFN